MLGRAVRNRAVDAVMKGDPKMTQRKPPSGANPGTSKMNPRPGLAVFIRFIRLESASAQVSPQTCHANADRGRDEWVRCIYIVPGIRRLAPAQPSAEPISRP